MERLQEVQKIYVLGSTTRDEITRIKTRFSNYISGDANSRINFSAAIQTEYEYLGGTGMNIVCNMRRFCDRKIFLFSVVGKDNDDILKLLSGDDINSDFVLINPEYGTSKAKGIVDEDQNHIWLIEDSVTKGVETNFPEHVDTIASLAIVSPIRKDIFMDFLYWAIKNRINYVFDPGMLLASLTPDELTLGIKSCRWLIANAVEINGLLAKTGLSLKEIVDGNTDVIVTSGSNGVVYHKKDEVIKVQGFAPVQVVDTSGAGDAWRAAFWGSLVMNNSVKKSLKVANSWASFSVEKYGAIGNYPNMESVKKRAGL